MFILKISFQDQIDYRRAAVTVIYEMSVRLQISVHPVYQAGLLETELVTHYRRPYGTIEYAVTIEASYGIAGSSGHHIPCLEHPLPVQSGRQFHFTYELIDEDIHPHRVLSAKLVVTVPHRQILVNTPPVVSK